MSVVEAVQRELESWGLGDSALGATALELGRQLDDLAAEQECEECGHVQSWTPHANSATSKAMCAKELTATLRELRALAPPKAEEDRVDEIAKRRALRVGGARSAS
jgi:hypothetical protein